MTMSDQAEASPSPVLSDGVPLESLIDREQRSVSLRVLSDAEIYQIELERVFARSWVAVAHESEIPSPGDYVTRYIGEDPVIVIRDKGGDIRILLNVCAHRGMRICRAEVGTSRTLTCPYHGWSYNRSGDLLAAPLNREMYGPNFDRSSISLRKARVETCAGMIFGTWNETAPSLDEYLGAYKWYLETAFARTDRNMVVAGPPQRWRIKANWKLPAENFSGDAYHALTLHRSIQELGLFAAGSEVAYGTNVTANGHGLRCLDAAGLWGTLFASAGKPFDETREPTAQEKFALTPPPGMSASLIEQIPRNLTPEQVQQLADAPPVVGNIFPNVAFLNMGMPAADGDLSAVITWRIWSPRGPNEVEVFSWALVEPDAPDEVRERTLRTTIQNFSDSGIFEVDDTEGWTTIQMNLRGVMARQQGLNYQAVSGQQRPDDWRGGGLVQHGLSRDDNQWAFWTRWFDSMTGKA